MLRAETHNNGKFIMSIVRGPAISQLCSIRGLKPLYRQVRKQHLAIGKNERLRRRQCKSERTSILRTLD